MLKQITIKQCAKEPSLDKSCVSCLIGHLYKYGRRSELTDPRHTSGHSHCSRICAYVLVAFLSLFHRPDVFIYYKRIIEKRRFYFHYWYEFRPASFRITNALVEKCRLSSLKKRRKNRRELDN